jgi:hypothetical protein
VGGRGGWVRGRALAGPSGRDSSAVLSRLLSSTAREKRVYRKITLTTDFGVALIGRCLKMDSAVFYSSSEYARYAT